LCGWKSGLAREFSAAVSPRPFPAVFRESAANDSRAAGKHLPLQSGLARAAAEDTARRQGPARFPADSTDDGKGWPAGGAGSVGGNSNGKQGVQAGI
jgi:hypothetical protein